MTARAGLDRIRDLVVAGNTVQMVDPTFLGALKSWLRFSPRYALATGDGLLSALWADAREAMRRGDLVAAVARSVTVMRRGGSNRLS